ncbi:GNAT family N-acetyltransferase [Embleya scabrispora]|uniref:GNAT family N-acetyltransferase n=1 Tax=Embleya scabrispora TaxID=159449 RepID=A0A1T3P691_9ACTN|nr:GNAT family N-acetyltransferase [Embleya scabrispora]OPC84465.1 GNAT family N-acetyltransferase [Embleya scabrispora]
MEIKTLGYDHPDVRKLVADVQQEYVHRYGGPDETAVDPAEFLPPEGLFCVAYDNGAPIACGGWRARRASPEDPSLNDGDAELKRMYVVPHARGRGLSRVILAHLEETARAAGRLRVVLETGAKQPEAVALYRSSGYERIPGFGYYRDYPSSMCFAKAL